MWASEATEQLSSHFSAVDFADPALALACGRTAPFIHIDNAKSKAVAAEINTRPIRYRAIQVAAGTGQCNVAFRLNQPKGSVRCCSGGRGVLVLRRARNQTPYAQQALGTRGRLSDEPLSAVPRSDAAMHINKSKTFAAMHECARGAFAGFAFDGSSGAVSHQPCFRPVAVQGCRPGTLSLLRVCARMMNASHCLTGQHPCD